MNSKPYDNPGINAFALSGPVYAAPRWRFWYVNWRGDDHEYVISVEGIELTSTPSEYAGWTVHGDVLYRDGQARDDTPRRSFLLEKIRDLEVVA